jgi:hypothetical protein
MAATHDVSWWVDWQDVGLDSVISPKHGIVDDPTLHGKEPQM